MGGPSDKGVAGATRCQHFLEYAILIVLYLTLNSSLNIMNRWALGIYGFSFPILLTICHMMFAFSVLLPVMVANRKLQHRETLSRQYRGLLCIGVFMALNVSLNNLSLVQISLSLNQVIRASMPVVVAAVAVFVEKKVPSRTEAGALLLLTAGVIIAVFEGKASGNTFGISLSITGVLCAAAMMSTAGRVLTAKIDVLQLAFYTAPVSSGVLLPFFWVLERERFLIYAAENGAAAVVTIVLCGSMVALAYNVIHNLLLQRTSSVAVTVLGEVKIVGLLILSAAILPGESSQFTARMTVGCVLAMLGFCMYSNARLLGSQAARLGSAAAGGQSTACHQRRKVEGDVEEGERLLEVAPRMGHVALDTVQQGKAPGIAKIWSTDRMVANVQASAVYSAQTAC